MAISQNRLGALLSAALQYRAALRSLLRAINQEYEADPHSPALIRLACQSESLLIRDSLSLAELLTREDIQFHSTAKANAKRNARRRRAAFKEEEPTP